LNSRDKLAPSDDKSPLRHFLANNVQVLLLYGFLLVAITGLCIYSPAFRFGPNLWTVARQAIIPAIIGMGQTLIIIGGGIDLSVASIVTLVSLICSGMMNSQPGMFLPITGLMLVMGVFVGLVNGIISYRGRVPPFITTLGMALLLQGAALAYTTVPKGGVPRIMGDLLYYNTLGPIPYPIILFAIIFALCLLILHRTAFGRAIFAIGGDQEVARRSGINDGVGFDNRRGYRRHQPFRWSGQSGRDPGRGDHSGPDQQRHGHPRRQHFLSTADQGFRGAYGCGFV